MLRTTLERARAALQEPLAGSRIVVAYDSLEYAREFPGTNSEEIKQAALVTRELLVLYKTYGLEHLDSDELDDAMTEVFGRVLDSELLSKLALAFSTIIRLGKNWDAFQKQAPKIFARDLSTAEMGVLFVVYSHCATASPYYTSRAKASKKQRGRKNKSRNAAGVEHDGELPGGQAVMNQLENVAGDPWWVNLPGMCSYISRPSDSFDGSVLNPRKVDPSVLSSIGQGSVQNAEKSQPCLSGVNMAGSSSDGYEVDMSPVTMMAMILVTAMAGSMVL